MLDKMLKLRNKKGFTLMEMLIVVAIIAIMIAIAIPTFNNSLKKAKDGTDQANARSLYAAVQLAIMNDDGTTLPASQDGSNTTEQTITFEGTAYSFNASPKIVSSDTAWTITTLPQGTTDPVTFTAKIG